MMPHKLWVSRSHDVEFMSSCVKVFEDSLSFRIEFHLMLFVEKEVVKRFFEIFVIIEIMRNNFIKLEMFPSFFIVVFEYLLFPAKDK